MARLRIATNSQWRDSSGERHEQSEFHSVVAFDKLAQIAVQYCTKGRQVYVEGKLRSRDYTDADGTRRFVTEVIAETIKLLGAPARAARPPRPTSSPTAPRPHRSGAPPRRGGRECPPLRPAQ
jgi:single-strand DNA-binding protein